MDIDCQRLNRFASVGLCPRCRGELRSAGVTHSVLVCPNCSDAIKIRTGVVLALPTGKTDTWAAGISTDMDAKSETYVHKYNNRTRASSGFFTRRDLALELIGPTPGKVLEAGCGPGVVSPMLANLGLDTHGMDLSIGQLSTAARRDPCTLYVQGDLERLPYSDAMFDTVVLLGVFEYVDVPHAVALELARVLKPGARLIMSVPNSRGLERRWTHHVYLPLSGLAKRALGRTAPRYGRRLYSLKSLAKLFEQAGLRVDKTRFFDLVLAPPPLDRMLRDSTPVLAMRLEERLRGRLRQLLAGQLMVSATGERR
jgi:SAM-dependent methyltransferase/uncharacterized protein YbaR (Trm112 family)